MQIQLVPPGQIQIQGGQAVQVQGQQGQTQQIIIQQPQTAVTAGQTQVIPPALPRARLIGEGCATEPDPHLVKTTQSFPLRLPLEHVHYVLFVHFLQTQQQIAVQGQQVAQTAEGQTIVYQPVNADGTILQQGMGAPGFPRTC